MLMRLTAFFFLGGWCHHPATLRGSTNTMFSQRIWGFEKDDVVFCDILQEMDINLKIGLMMHNGDYI